MLDQMSGGRLEIGFGRGASPIELGYFGQDAKNSQAIYTEGLELIIKGLTEQSLTRLNALLKDEPPKPDSPEGGAPSTDAPSSSGTTGSVGG